MGSSPTRPGAPGCDGTRPRSGSTIAEGDIASVMGWRHLLDRPDLLQLVDQHGEVLFGLLFPHVKLGNERVSYRLEWMLAVNEVPDAGPDFVQRVETVNLPDLPAYGDQDDLVGDSAGDEGGILVKDCAQRRHRHFLAPWPHRVKKGGCNLSVRRTDTG